ncbi:MAG: hypothetical protein WC492_02575 [Candidatus Micrarchaeia archaeon]
MHKSIRSETGSPKSEKILPSGRVAHSIATAQLLAHDLKNDIQSLNFFSIENSPEIKKALTSKGVAYLQAYALFHESASNLSTLAYLQVQKSRSESDNTLMHFASGMEFYKQALSNFKELSKIVSLVNSNSADLGTILPLYEFQNIYMSENLEFFSEVRQNLSEQKPNNI